MAFGFVVDSNNILGQMVEESGKYNVRISDTSTVTMAKTGKQMAVLDFEVQDGDYVGGKIRYDNVVWDETSSEAIDRSKKSFNTVLVAAGVPDGTQLTDMNQFVQGLIGQQMNVSVEWEQNNKGQYNLAVKSHNKFDTTGSKPSGIKRPEGAMLPNNNTGSSFGGAPHTTQTSATGATFGASMPQSSPATNNTGFGGFGQQPPKQAPQQGGFTPGQMFGQQTQTAPTFGGNGQTIEIDDKDLPF